MKTEKQKTAKLNLILLKHYIKVIKTKVIINLGNYLCRMSMICLLR